MPPIGWLVVAIAAAAAAYFVGWPAWETYRGRQARDTNAERYHAWRGRAARGQPSRAAMTSEERRRVYGGAALGAVAIVALLAFFLTT